MKRFTATEKWDKSWFQDLSPALKCLWNYLCDNADPAGVWEANWRLASFQIGEKFDAAALKAFGDRVEVLPNGKVWLTGFCAFQYGQLSRECRAQIHVFRSLEKHGLLARVLKGMESQPDTLPAKPDTLSDRVLNREQDKETDQERKDSKETKSVPEKTPLVCPPALDTPVFRERFKKWIEVRKAQKKPPKDWHGMFNEQLQWLAKFGEESALEILGLSIRNNYQGLVEPKAKPTGQRSELPAPSPAKDGVPEMPADFPALAAAHYGKSGDWRTLWGQKYARTDYADWKQEAATLKKAV